MKWKNGELLNVDGVSVRITKADTNDAEAVLVDGEEERPYRLVRKGDVIAGGRTLRSAELALQKKLFEQKTEEERIREFVSKHPPDERHTVDEWMDIHRDLTGACYMGGLRFIRNHEIKRYEEFTTLQFLDIVDGAYGGDLIQRVKGFYEGGKAHAT